MAALVTSSFVVSSIRAFYLLRKKNEEYGKLFLKTGVIFGLTSCTLIIFPTGDLNAKNVAKYQPGSIAAIEDIFETEEGGSEIVLIGQPNMLEHKLDNKIAVPNILSFLTYMDWNAQIDGMDKFNKEDYLPYFLVSP